MKLNVIDLEGNTVERLAVEPRSIALRVNRELLHQAVVAAEANKRVGTACSKTRAEKAGSGRKLFRQKGTGRARMGPVRSPIRRGGGKAFGPKPRDYRINLPKKARRLATRQAVCAKLRDRELVVVSSFALPEAKTRLAREALEAMGVAGRKCLIVLAEQREPVWRAFRNIPRVGVTSVRELNAYDVLRSERLLVEAEAWAALTETAGS